MKYEKYIIPLILFLALVYAQQAWIHKNKEPVVWDEARHLFLSLAYYDYLTFSAADTGHLRITAGTLEGRYPPVVYFFTTPLYLFLGRSLNTALGVQLIFLLITFIYTYKLIFLLNKNSWNAWIGSLFCCCSPLFLHFTRRYLLDIPMAAWIPVILFYLIKSEYFIYRKPSIIFAVSCSFALLTRPNILPMIILPFLVSAAAGIFDRISRIQSIKNICMVLLCVFIISAPWYLVHFKAQSEFFSTQKEYNAGNNAPVFSAESILFYPMVSGLNFYFWTNLLVLIGIIIALVKWRSPVIMVFLAVIGGYLFQTWMSYKDWRFLVPLVPALAVLGVFWIPRAKPAIARTIFYAWIIMFSVISYCYIGLDWQPWPGLYQKNLPLYYRYYDTKLKHKLFFIESMKAFPFRDPPSAAVYPVHSVLRELTQNWTGKDYARIGVFPYKLFPNPIGLQYYASLQRLPLIFDWVHNIPEFHKTINNYNFLIAPDNRPVFGYSTRWQTEKERIFENNLDKAIFTPIKEYEILDEVQISIYKVWPERRGM